MRCLFLLTLVLVGGACDTASEGGAEAGDGRAASTMTTDSGASSGGGESTASSGSGGVASASASVTGSGAGSQTSGALSTGTGGATSSGPGAQATSTGGASGEGSGGASNTSGGGSAAGGTGGQAATACDDAGLVWKSGKKTTYTSYPDPNSEECIVYNGCMWAGWFANCDEQQSEAWVETHDIAAMFPDSGYELHDICIRSGERTMIVTIYDTCGDSDCDGCCTENKGDADALIDLESFTNARWGLPDGDLEWADLGPTSSDGCQ